jgi:hypothetical protein
VSGVARVESRKQDARGVRTRLIVSCSGFPGAAGGSDILAPGPPDVLERPELMGIGSTYLPITISPQGWTRSCSSQCESEHPGVGEARFRSTSTWTWGYRSGKYRLAWALG